MTTYQNHESMADKTVEGQITGYLGRYHSEYVTKLNRVLKRHTDPIDEYLNNPSHVTSHKARMKWEKIIKGRKES